MYPALSSPPRPWQWDIFCKVIDNYGDLGVCWRLACQAAATGDAVRLWVDDPSALAWMAPHGAAGVTLRRWHSLPPNDEAASDVLVEAFGCEVPAEFLANCAQQVSVGATKPVWINLEYLSAEPWSGRCHGLPSPVFHGPAAGWTKWFFYPGFTNDTGGLLVEKDLSQRERAFDQAAWRAAYADPAHGTGTRWVSLFCYEPASLADWLSQCAELLPCPTHLLVTAGRAKNAVQIASEEISKENDLQSLWNKRGKLSISNIEPLPQQDYDALLWACDLNFVRGEDSLVRALLAGRPFVWHVYPQDDGVHSAKLETFLDWLDAPQSLRRFHAVWNGLQTGPLPLLDDHTLAQWGQCAAAARTRVLQQSDLLTQLLGFCASKR